MKGTLNSAVDDGVHIVRAIATNRQGCIRPVDSWYSFDPAVPGTVSAEARRPAGVQPRANPGKVPPWSTLGCLRERDWRGMACHWALPAACD